MTEALPGISKHVVARFSTHSVVKRPAIPCVAKVSRKSNRTVSAASSTCTTTRTRQQHHGVPRTDAGRSYVRGRECNLRVVGSFVRALCLRCRVLARTVHIISVRISYHHTRLPKNVLSTWHIDTALILERRTLNIAKWSSFSTRTTGQVSEHLPTLQDTYQAL